jgi:hypothetical protein
MEVQTLREWSVYYPDLIQRVRVIPKSKRAKRDGNAFVPVSSFFGPRSQRMFATVAVLRNGYLAWGRATQSGRRSVQTKSRVAPDCEPCADGIRWFRLQPPRQKRCGGSRVNAQAPRGSHILSRCRSMVCIALPIDRERFLLPSPLFSKGAIC